MEITRIDYDIVGFKNLKGQSFYRNCEPIKAIAMFQAWCRKHNYLHVITNYAWFSELEVK